jgi:hypothetical protein
MFSPPYRNPLRILRNWRVLWCGSVRMEPGRYGFNSVWTRFKIRLCVTVAYITTHSAHFHPDQIRIMTMNVIQYTTRVDAVLCCGLKRVHAVRTGSIRLLIRNWNISKKFWTWPKKFFRRIVVAESPGIDTGYNAGLCGWNRVDAVLIPYGPGSKSHCVWL